MSCDQMAIVYHRVGNRCGKHWRFNQMRACAKASGKYAPPIQQLESLTPMPFMCPICKRELIWFMKDDPKHRGRVISLQHDRNGSIRLICHSCNSRHDDRPGDTFYAEGMSRRRCYSCKKTKSLDQFGPDKSRYQGKKCICRKCWQGKYMEWKNKNREHVNAKWREAWRKRKGRA